MSHKSPHERYVEAKAMMGKEVFDRLRKCPDCKTSMDRAWCGIKDALKGAGKADYTLRLACRICGVTRVYDMDANLISARNTEGFVLTQKAKKKLAAIAAAPIALKHVNAAPPAMPVISYSTADRTPVRRANRTEESRAS